MCDPGFSPEDDFRDPELHTPPEGAVGGPCWETYESACAAAIAQLHLDLIPIVRGEDGCIQTAPATIALLTCQLAMANAWAAFLECFDMME